MAKPSQMRATIVIVAVLLACIACTAMAADETGTQNVMLFPVKSALGPDRAQMADDLVVMMKDGLMVTGKYMVLGYDLNSNVCIQRAVAEQKIKEDDVKTAFPTDAQGVARAQKVCEAIATDIGIVGSLDNYSFDAARKEAKVGLTVQLIKAGSPDPVTIVVTGIAAGKTDDQSQTESGIALAALNDAADKVMTKVIDATTVAVPAAQSQVGAPAEKSKSHKKGLLSAMLGALLLGIALGGN